jgi:NADH-quinone oxidoreductase subunit M
MDAWLLTFVIFFPLVGVLIILFINEEQKNTIRGIALTTTLIDLALSLLILTRFNSANPDLQLSVKVPWIEVADFVIAYEVGVDGLSILLVLLTTLLTTLAILSDWEAIQEGVKNYMIFFLLLETGMLGVFLSLDLFLFYLFWEFSLVPMYFLVGIWGGPRRIYAAIKFFLYTMAGSIVMLLAILFLGIEGRSFSLSKLLTETNIPQMIPPDVQFWLFLAFAVAFAIKVPMWPLHSWLPDAHVEAPTSGSVVLASVLLKMGAYGFIRFNLSLFPHASVRLAPWFAGVAVVGIIYGAIVSFAQSDMKKLVAYSSISHMGFVMLGLFALNTHGLQGAILQMINHGLSTGGLFIMVGAIYQRLHTRVMSAYGGLWGIMPIYGAITLIITLSSMALPGLNGFVGEFTVLLGAFDSSILGSYWFAGIGAIGVILAAIYLLQMYQKVFLGPVTHEENRNLQDLKVREIVIMIPLLVLIFWIGLYPRPFFHLMAPAVDKLVATLQTAAMAGVP